MEFYHVLNRGINKMDVFCDDGDRMRFVRGMFVYNDSKPTPNSVTQREQWKNQKRQRGNLVKIHAWCLMNNHYHLLLSAENDDFSNISLFMRKLNMGYAKFFNEKYQRSGYLWQGKYKRIHIEQDSQFMYIPYYIHLNPLDMKYAQWRDGNVSDINKAVKFLDSYRWSSWHDYTGKKNFSSILYKKVCSKILKNRNFQIKEIKRIACVPNNALANNSNYLELSDTT